MTWPSFSNFSCIHFFFESKIKKNLLSTFFKFQKMTKKKILYLWKWGSCQIRADRFFHFFLSFFIFYSFFFLSMFYFQLLNQLFQNFFFCHFYSIFYFLIVSFFFLLSNFLLSCIDFCKWGFLPQIYSLFFHSFLFFTHHFTHNFYIFWFFSIFNFFFLFSFFFFENFSIFTFFYLFFILLYPPLYFFKFLPPPLLPPSLFIF